MYLTTAEIFDEKEFIDPIQRKLILMTMQDQFSEIYQAIQNNGDIKILYSVMTDELVVAIGECLLNMSKIGEIIYFSLRPKNDDSDEEVWV